MSSKNTKEKKYYILMADIIDSRDADGDKLMQEFKKLVTKVSKEKKNSFLSPMTITLGDEFQSVVKSFEEGIDVLIKLEEEKIEFGTEIKLRYVLCYGEIDTPINPESAHEMLGKGLTKSRAILSKLKKEAKRFHFDLQSEQSEILNKIFFLYSSIIDKWKVDDYELIHSFLQEADYYKVAEKLNKNRGYTWRKEKALEIKQYFTTKELINDIKNL